MSTAPSSTLVDHVPTDRRLTVHFLLRSGQLHGLSQPTALQPPGEHHERGTVTALSAVWLHAAAAAFVFTVSAPHRSTVPWTPAL